jgi:putative drug exporter of the RND superfamily
MVYSSRFGGVSSPSSLGRGDCDAGTLSLLFDTLVVRSFMTPSIAAVLGRWFWWPIKVRPRPASTMLRPTGPRPLVRSLLLGENDDATRVLGDGEAKTAPLPKPSSG